MKNVLLLDTETTGMDPAQGARCIEVAVQVYSIELATPVASFSSLMWDPAYGAPENPQEKTNGISAKMLAEAPPPIDVWRRVRAVAQAGDVQCVVAHRAEFDMKFTPPMKRPTEAGPEDPLPWVCTKSDFKWPRGLRGAHLTHLALGLGLGLVSAHRAMTDVDTMSRVLSRIAEMGGNLQELFRLALRPKVRVVSLAPFEMKDIVKEHGFFWEPAPVKQWYRWMPPEDRDELPFHTRIDPTGGQR